MPEPITAVLFDMDGVITDTMPIHCRAWQAALKECGINVPALEIYRREGQRGIESVQELGALAGQMFSSQQARNVLARKEKIFHQIFRPRFVSGARAFLRRVSRNGLATALVTGTARGEMLRVLPAAILSLFDTVITGSDVQNGKPHPEPYLKALRSLKLSPSRALVVENAPFGIMAARSAGISCWAVTTSLPARYLTNANRVFRGFATLERAFFSRRGPCLTSGS